MANILWFRCPPKIAASAFFTTNWWMNNDDKCLVSHVSPFFCGNPSWSRGMAPMGCSISRCLVWFGRHRWSNVAHGLWLSGPMWIEMKRLTSMWIPPAGHQLWCVRFFDFVLINMMHIDLNVMLFFFRITKIRKPECWSTEVRWNLSNLPKSTENTIWFRNDPLAAFPSWWLITLSNANIAEVNNKNSTWIFRIWPFYTIFPPCCKLISLVYRLGHGSL